MLGNSSLATVMVKIEGVQVSQSFKCKKELNVTSANIQNNTTVHAKKTYQKMPQISFDCRTPSRFSLESSDLELSAPHN
jgi:hypothetical protein